MKNTLILALFLFIASFSFVSCDGSDGDAGVMGLTGPSGLTGSSGLQELGFVEGQHFDFTDANVALVCPAGYHAHMPNSPDGVCRTDSGGLVGGRDENGESLHGCVEGYVEYFVNGEFSACRTPESLGH